MLLFYGKEPENRNQAITPIANAKMKQIIAQTLLVFLVTSHPYFPQHSTGKNLLRGQFQQCDRHHGANHRDTIVYLTRNKQSSCEANQSIEERLTGDSEPSGTLPVKFLHLGSECRQKAAASQIRIKFPTIYVHVSTYSVNSRLIKQRRSMSHQWVDPEGHLQVSGMEALQGCVGSNQPGKDAPFLAIYGSPLPVANCTPFA